jgi:hypothetical protein
LIGSLVAQKFELSCAFVLHGLVVGANDARVCLDRGDWQSAKYRNRGCSRMSMFHHPLQVAARGPDGRARRPTGGPTPAGTQRTQHRGESETTRVEARHGTGSRKPSALALDAAYALHVKTGEEVCMDRPQDNEWGAAARKRKDPAQTPGARRQRLSPGRGQSSACGHPRTSPLFAGRHRADRAVDPTTHAART